MWIGRWKVCWSRELRKWRCWREMCCVYRSPIFHDGQYLVRRHICQGDIVCLGEGKYIAFSCHGLRPEQNAREAWRFLCRRVFCLRLFYGAVIVYKDEGILIVRILVAGSSLVARTEIAFWIIDWQVNLRRSFLRASGTRSACASCLRDED